MGANLSGSSSQSQTNATTAGSNSNTYSSGQTGLQDLLTQHLASLIPSLTSGTLSPDVQAQETGAADTINKTSSGLGSRMTKFLAARGFGQSGQSGQVQLQNELGRQSALGANSSAAAATQVQANGQQLSQALQAAYSAMGSSGTGSSSGTSSGSQLGFTAGAHIPGFGP